MKSYIQQNNNGGLSAFQKELHSLEEILKEEIRYSSPKEKYLSLLDYLNQASEKLFTKYSHVAFRVALFGDENPKILEKNLLLIEILDPKDPKRKSRTALLRVRIVETNEVINICAVSKQWSTEAFGYLCEE